MIEKPHIITLSGKPGSGKTSTAREVAKLLGYRHISAGAMVRKMAKENGMSLKELNEQALKDDAIDKKIDHYIQGLINVHNAVIDARIAFHWIPKSFKVFLTLDSEVAAARVFRDMESSADRVGEKVGSIEEIEAEIRSRINNEKERFMTLYNIDPFKPSNFDLVIHTERNNPLTVALWVHDYYLKWLKTESWERVVESVPLGYSDT